MFDKCGGAANLRTPALTIKRCPECGEEVELFSDDTEVVCKKCGFTIYNDIESCIQWCKYAKECVGEELYNKLKKKD
ncbi:MAG: transposase [Nitrospira sp.]|nr:transposase [Nitrospira sp.]